MNGKIKSILSARSLADHRFSHAKRFGQKGALLIGLIITMVILSGLGAGMVYFFSSSVMDPVFSNFSQRAYYAAESGMRYAVSTYKNTLPLMNKSQFISQINAGGGTTVTLPKNGQAVLTAVDNMPGETVDVVTATPTGALQTIYVSDSLTIVDDAQAAKFPAVNGFFQIDGQTGYFRYKKRTNNTLEGIYGPGTWPKNVAAGTAITAPAEQVSITAKGYYPQAGIFNMNRTVKYAWVLSGSLTGGTPTPPAVLNLPNLVANNPFGNDPSLGTWTTEQVDGNTALTVDQSTSGVRVEAVIGYSGEPNPFRTAWTNALKFLSYDAQVKIATGTPGNPFTDKPESYVAGLTFRSTETVPGKWRSYGLSFMNYGGSGIPQALQPRLYALWTNKTYNQGESVSLLDNQGYYTNYICDRATCPSTNAGKFDNDYWTVYSPPMILLWSRGGRSVTDSGDRWLAYKLLDDEQALHAGTGGGVVDSEGKLKDWSTILLRIVEAASIKLNTTTDTTIATGTVVTDAAGKTATVYRKINDNDGEIVLLLHNVQEGFTRPATVEIYATDAAWGFRPRDNYIWAMFGDTSTHPSANDDPLDNTRNASQRLTDAESADPNIANPTYAGQKIFWPPDNMSDWGNTLANGTVNDYFKLVRWNDILNTRTENMDLYIMGTNDEMKAILRTDLWTTGGYVRTAFPHEFGVHALGDQAVNTYFDDLAISFQGQSAGSGIPFLTPIQE